MTPGIDSEGHRKRLKERFKGSGLRGFHDYEALELLLTYAIPRRDVKPLAKELIRKFKGFKGVFEARSAELAEVPGVGESAAALMALPRVVARAYLGEQSSSRSTVKCPDDAVEMIEALPPGEGGEDFLALYLNTKNEVLGIERLHEGSLMGSALSPRKVIEKAFKHNARSVIFVHRVGDEFAFPSRFDKKLVGELEDAATAIDIIVHDHILVARESHLSARENGLLKK